MARVPGVPSVQVQPQSGPLNVSVPEGAFGPIGDVLAMGGKVAGQMADTLGQHAEQRAQLDARIEASDAALATSKAQDAIDLHFQQNFQGVKAEPGLVGALKEIEQVRKDGLAKMQSPLAQDLYNQQSRIGTIQAASRLSRFAAQETFRYKNDRLDAQAKTAATQATKDNFGFYAAAVGNVGAMKAELNGWSEDETKVWINEQLGTTAHNLSVILAGDDPKAARAFYDKSQELMTLGQRYNAGNVITSAEENLAISTVVDREIASAAATPSNLAMRGAIAQIETGSFEGDYSKLGTWVQYKTGPNKGKWDRAYGKYQVMGVNIPIWTKKHLGKAMTPAEFVADQAAQDKVFDAEFGEYVQKYGLANAASMWFTGQPLKGGAGKADPLGTTGASYAQKFMRNLGAGDRFDNIEENARASFDRIAADPSLKGDPVLIDRAQTRLMTRIGQERTLNNLQTGAAYERLLGAAQATNMSDPTQLQKAYPGAAEDYASLSAQSKRRLDASILATGNQLTQARQDTYYELRGMSDEMFLAQDLSKKDLTNANRKELFNRQRSLVEKKERSDWAKNSVTAILKFEPVQQIVRGRRDLEPDTPNGNYFRGALSVELEAWAENNKGKKISENEAAKLVANVAARMKPIRTYTDFGFFQTQGTVANEPQPFTITPEMAKAIQERYAPIYKRPLEDWEVGQEYQRAVRQAEQAGGR